MPRSLELAIEHIYKPCGLEINGIPQRESESVEYNACRLKIEGKNIVYRDAKTTQHKIGQFVTVWKRPFKSIVPFDSTDDIDILIVGVRAPNHRGQFILDKEILIKKGVVSHAANKGKLAFRVYPPWTYPSKYSAIRTQKWQLNYFIDYSNPYQYIDREKLYSLLNV